MINREILDATPLPDLITQLKYDAIEEFTIILIELLHQKGFGFEDLLMGLAGYCHRLGLDKTENLLEQANSEYRTEKSKRQ